MTNLELCMKLCPTCYTMVAPLLDERAEIEKLRQENAILQEEIGDFLQRFVFSLSGTTVAQIGMGGKRASGDEG